MSLDRTPLPRFWYLPRGEKAAFVMTGDDHARRRDRGPLRPASRRRARPGCSVADWECVRATSYVYPDTPLTAGAGGAYQAAGLRDRAAPQHGLRELHAGVARRAIWRRRSSPSFASDLPEPRRAAHQPHPLHRLERLGDTSRRSSSRNGIRLDTNYYYWPGTWVQDRPGMFTGSGFPMRFADPDGSLIDVYQAATQMTDESDIDIADAHRARCSTARSAPQGYYGVFTANMHTDDADHAGADAIVAAAQARGVPVISAAQLLDWTDGRNNVVVRRASATPTAG